MSNEFMLYLMTRTDSLISCMEPVAFFSIFIAIMLLALWAALKFAEEVEIPLLFRAGRNLIITGIVASIIIVITPTKSDFIFIYGGSAIIEAAKSNRAANIGNKTLGVVEKWLEDAADEKKP